MCHLFLSSGTSTRSRNAPRRKRAKKSSFAAYAGRRSCAQAAWLCIVAPTVATNPSHVNNAARPLLKRETSRSTSNGGMRTELVHGKGACVRVRERVRACARVSFENSGKDEDEQFLLFRLHFGIKIHEVKDY